MKVHNLLLVLLAFGSCGLDLHAAAVAAAAPAHGTLPQGKAGSPSFSSGQGFQADLAARKHQEALEKERLAILAAKTVDDLSAQLPKAKSKLDENWKKAKAKVAPADLDLVKDIQELSNAAERVKAQVKSTADSVKGTHDDRLLKTVVKLLGSGSAPSPKVLASAIAEAKKASKFAHDLAATSLKVADEVDGKNSNGSAEAKPRLAPETAAIPLSARIEAQVPSTGIEKDGVTSLAQFATKFHLVMDQQVGSSSGGSNAASVDHGQEDSSLNDPASSQISQADSAAAAAPAVSE